MKIIGGTYRERVLWPDHEDDVGGSGFRAAAALPRGEVTLHTAIHAEGLPVLAAAAGAVGVAVEHAERTHPVIFEYLSPIVSPVLWGKNTLVQERMKVEAEHVLAFGMVERIELSFSAAALVYDPQSITDQGMTRFRKAITKKALCANANEVLALAGTGAGLEVSSMKVLEDTGASCLVAKAGARGCLVTSASGGKQEWINPIPTASVWKLGSGDVFSAAFAHAWFAGADDDQAARVGSASAAWWCSTRQNLIPEEILRAEVNRFGLDFDALSDLARLPRVYLAGPFFTLAERWLIESCRNFLLELGATVFSPIHDVGSGTDEVAPQDLEGLESADVVFALFDSWDPGTVFEAGWATKKGTPVVGMVTNMDAHETTMLAGSGTELHDDLTTALYRAIWVGRGAPLISGRNSA